jgi:hypothetical protein
MPKALVGAYWGDRSETRTACAERLMRFFAALREHDPALGRWFRRMNKKTDPVMPLPESAAGLSDLLTVVLDDSTPRQVMEECGFSLGTWRGFDAVAPASFSFSCGAFGPHAHNALILTCDDLTTSHDLLRVYLEATAEAFEPDDAIAHDSITLPAAHEAIKKARAEGLQLHITDPPALYRYKRGAGFTCEPAQGTRVSAS